MIAWPPKDPNEILDYQLQWVLDTGEVLLTSTFSIVDGTVTIDRSSFVTPENIATVWLLGGTIGEVCHVLNRVTTRGGRTYDETAKLRIRSK